MPPKPLPIDPLSGPKLAIAGRIVVMDERFSVIQHGVISIEGGKIVAMQDSKAPPPAGFESTKVLNVRGTIFPGLIELHNHLSYNVLPLWNVPKEFTNRGQWGIVPPYKKYISGPMKIVGSMPGVLPSLARFVECKCLVGGVTTTQGIQLFSNAGIRKYYRGIVRNVEQTDDHELPEASARIADIEAGNGKLFLERLRRQNCMLLHLSEGTDAKARAHFLALRISRDEWAITPQLIGIHSTGLQPEDFDVMARNGGSIAWSPLSNLLLYGKTTDVRAAKAAGVKIGLGSDWSPSGSKNLLGELKIARLVIQEHGGFLSDRELVSLATREAASILRWDKGLGTLEAGKRADLLVIDGTSGDPYSALLEADENSMRLVMINGVARFGRTEYMSKLNATGESIRIGNERRTLYLSQTTGDPDVQNVTLSHAMDTLRETFEQLPRLARELEQRPRDLVPTLNMRGLSEAPTWFLALDEIEDAGVQLRHHLPVRGTTRDSAPSIAVERGLVPLSAIVEPVEMGGLTAIDDPRYVESISAARNLPQYVKRSLRTIF